MYREEFCILAKNLLKKCDGPKRKPLEREYPNICSTLAPLKTLKPGTFCQNNQWTIPKQSAGIANCTKMGCRIEDEILRYTDYSLISNIGPNLFIDRLLSKHYIRCSLHNT